MEGDKDRDNKALVVFVPLSRKREPHTIPQKYNFIIYVYFRYVDAL